MRVYMAARTSCDSRIYNDDERSCIGLRYYIVDVVTRYFKTDARYNSNNNNNKQ